MRVLVVHSDLYGFGGAELVCAHAIAALQECADVTLVHAGGHIDVARIQRWSGLVLDPCRVHFVTAGWLGKLAQKRSRLSLLKYAVAVRYARKMMGEYSVVLSTFGECPTDHPRTVQYIHIPQFLADPNVFRYSGVGSPRLVDLWIRAGYVRLCRTIAGWNLSWITRGQIAANSMWTADVVREAYRLSDVKCVYPPVNVQIVPGTTSWVPFDGRDDGFVMLGRIHPSKRIELGIEIVDRLRQLGHSVSLTIIGVGQGPYVEQLRQQIQAKPYVKMHLNVPKADVEAIVVRQKYGLHCFEYEHFGLAAAEMQLLGCIVFVPDNGGQREVISSPLQRYTSVEDAIAKVGAVLSSRDRQNELLEAARRASHLVGAGQFEKSIRKLVLEL